MSSLSHILNPESVDFHRINRFPPTPPSLASPATQYDSPVLSADKVRMARTPAGRDATKFPVESLPKGDVNFPPFDNLSKQARELVQSFGIESLHDIRYRCLHIPYNSGKKEFGLRTGRESLEVFRYVFKNPQDDTEHIVMWDYQIGLVRITPFFKSCKFAKTAPAKMLNLNPGLREISHSITGGSISAQGYWMPYACTKAVCATFCYHIAGALIPIFGPDFPALCVRPGAPEFNQWIIEPQIIRDATEEAKMFRERYGQSLSSSRRDNENSGSLGHEPQPISLAHEKRNPPRLSHPTNFDYMDVSQHERGTEQRISGTGQYGYTSELVHEPYRSRGGSPDEVLSPSRFGGSLLPRQLSIPYTNPSASLKDSPRRRPKPLPTLDPRLSAVPTTSKPTSYMEDVVTYPRELSHFHGPQMSSRHSPSLSPHQTGLPLPAYEDRTMSNTRTYAAEEHKRAAGNSELYVTSPYNVESTARWTRPSATSYGSMPLSVEEERGRYFSGYHQPDDFYERGRPASYSAPRPNPEFTRPVGDYNSQRPKKSRRMGRAWTHTEDDAEGAEWTRRSQFPTRDEDEMYWRHQNRFFSGPGSLAASSPSQPTQILSYVRNSPLERLPSSLTPSAPDLDTHHQHHHVYPRTGEEEARRYRWTLPTPYHNNHQQTRDTRHDYVRAEEEQNTAAAALLLELKTSETVKTAIPRLG